MSGLADASGAGSKGGFEQPTWTIMLYLSGDNNLSPEMVRALADIRLEGVPRGITFTIQYDPRTPGFQTFRYALETVESDEDRARRARDAVRNLGEGPLPIPEYLERRIEYENSADPCALARFVHWSTTTYPSTYRMLILSGHGSGAVGDFLSDDNAQGGRPASLNVASLARALRFAQQGTVGEEGTCRCQEDKEERAHAAAARAKSGRARPRRDASGAPRLLHILGMDSCLMGMAEVGHEVQDQVDFLVGSEGFMPNVGWPYSELLSRLKLVQPVELTPAVLARKLVDDTIAYYKQFIPAGTSLDMSACDVSAFERDEPPKAVAASNGVEPPQGLVGAVKALVDALALPAQAERLDDVQKTVRDLVVAAHWRAQSYKFEQYTDLWDFCEQLREAAHRLGKLLPGGNLATRLDLVVSACERVKEAVVRVAPRSDHAGPEFQHSRGLAIFFPWSAAGAGSDDVLEGYSKLAFPDQSGWAAFLKAYLVVTEREARIEDGVRIDLPAPPPAAVSPVGAKHADSVSKHADSVSKHADSVSKHADTVSKHADTISKFASMIQMLSPGAPLPWSMKNPPQGVRWPRKPAANLAPAPGVSPSSGRRTRDRRLPYPRP